MDLNSRDFAANGGLCPGGYDLGAMHGELKGAPPEGISSRRGQCDWCWTMQLARIDPHILRAQRARTSFNAISKLLSSRISAMRLFVWSFFRDTISIAAKASTKPRVQGCS